MAYNKINYHKKLASIVDVYKSEKHHDIPDTFIVKKIFPKHNIFISYRTWMNIKGTPLPSSATNQLNLFSPN